MIISVLGFLWGMATIFLHKFEELIVLPTSYIDIDFERAMQETLNGIIDLMFSMLVPLLALVIAVAVMAHFFQFGFLFAFESIKPDYKKT